MGKLRYTIDVTVQEMIGAGTPVPIYRYTEAFDPVANATPALLREQALGRASRKAFSERHADEKVPIRLETTPGECDPRVIAANESETHESAAQRFARELIACRAELERVQDDRDDAYKRAQFAEKRCVRIGHAVDVRDRHSRDLVDALIGDSHHGPPPWWVTATRALDSLDSLANSAQLEPEGEQLEETLSRVGDEVRGTLTDLA